MIGKYKFNVNKYLIEYDDNYFAYLNVADANKIVRRLNELDHDKNLMEIIDKKILCNTRGYYNNDDENIKRECEIRLKLLESIKKDAEK